MRAAIYARVSKDATRERLAVTRQEADCRTLCADRGWDVASVYADNDISASGRVARPAYGQLLAALDARTIDAVVVWHPDRLHRSPRELEDFVDLLEATGATVATVTAGDWDLATPEGRLTARITGAVARKEWEDKCRRAKRKAAELRDAGKPSGMLGYGYHSGGTIHDDQAAVIVAACGAILAGANLTSIVTDLNTRNIPAPRAATWSTTSLKKILMAGRIAGLREHDGKIHGPATWPAIIDRITWERVRATLEDRPAYRARRQYLLSGIAECGECGGPLLGHTRYTRRREPVATYACVKSRGGCGGVYATAAPIETEVHRMMDWASGAGVLHGRLESPRSELSAERTMALIDAEEAKLVDYARMLDAKELEPVEWRALRTTVLDRLGVLRAQLSTASNPAGMDELARRPWDELSAEQQRALIGLTLEVKVRRVGHGGPSFVTKRLSVTWRR